MLYKTPHTPPCLCLNSAFATMYLPREEHRIHIRLNLHIRSNLSLNRSTTPHYHFTPFFAPKKVHRKVIRRLYEVIRRLYASYMSDRGTCACLDTSGGAARRQPSTRPTVPRNKATAVGGMRSQRTSQLGAMTQEAVDRGHAGVRVWR